jgi:hypothetical protein
VCVCLCVLMCVCVPVCVPVCVCVLVFLIRLSRFTAMCSSVAEFEARAFIAQGCAL